MSVVVGKSNADFEWGTQEKRKKQSAGVQFPVRSRFPEFPIEYPIFSADRE
jgi:hypothetical protein